MGLLKKYDYTRITRKGATGKRVFEHARVCARPFKPDTGKCMGPATQARIKFARGTLTIELFQQPRLACIIL